jgi:hypothetical protein
VDAQQPVGVWGNVAAREDLSKNDGRSTLLHSLLLLSTRFIVHNRPSSVGRVRRSASQTAQGHA